MNKVTCILALVGMCLVGSTPAWAGAARDWRRELDDAISGIRQNDYTVATRVLREGREQVQPYLSAYIDDPNADVRAALTFFLKGSRTLAALRILEPLVGDLNPNVSARAISVLGRDFDCAALGQVGPELRKQLARDLLRNMSWIMIPLLACFPDQAAVKEELLLYLKKQGPPEKQVASPFSSMTAHLALSELGVAGSHNWVLQEIKTGRPVDVAIFLDYLRFVNDPPTLDALYALLDDTRPARKVIAHGDIYLRLCDIAITAWLKRLGFDHRAELGTSPPPASGILLRPLKDSDLNRLRAKIRRRYQVWRARQKLVTPVQPAVRGATP